MHLLFFDSEFTELGIDPKLISIGLVSEDGINEFYAELSDTYQPKACSAFVQEVVLPHLQGGDVLMTMNELAMRLGSWIENFEQPVQLVTDSLSWDWPWIQEIFNDVAFWPKNLDGKPMSLYANKVNTTFIEQFAEKAFSSNVPHLRRHHALDDAKVNRLALLAWNECQK